METTASLEPGTTVAIVGDGRLGGVLARALNAAGMLVLGPVERGGVIPDADIVLLCVPDSAIPDAATAARPHARFLGHVSGATGLDTVDFSVHPLQTFTGTESPAVFHGVGAAIAGRTDDALAIAGQLADVLGAHVFRIDDAHRASYHAAASFASNFVLAVLDAAETLAEAAGVPGDEARRLLAPLVGQTLENWVAAGASAVLTGPIARGDEATVARQRAAAEEVGLQQLFDALAIATREITREARA